MKHASVMNLRTLCAAAVLTVLAACASDDDPSAEIAPLPDFKASYEPHELWDATLDTTMWESLGLSMGSAWRAVWPWAGSPGRDRPAEMTAGQRLQPTASQDKVFAATPEGLVQAFDAKGDTLWREWLGDGLTGGVSAGGGLVLVATANGDVIALDAEKGEEKWRASVGAEVVTPPAIGENTVVVRAIDGRVVALKADTGERLWLGDRALPSLTQRGTSGVLVAGGLALVGFDNGKVTAFRLSNGQELWEKRIAQPTGRSDIERLADADTTPVVFGTTLYAASLNGAVVAIDLRNGETLWQREMSTARNIAVDEKMVYVSTARGHVSAVDRAGGFVVWTQKLLENRRLTAPAAFGSWVVVGDFEGELHFLNRDTGEFGARVSVDGDGFQSDPVVSNERLLVMGVDGELQVYGQR